MAASNIYDSSRLFESLKAAQYSPDALRAMNDNLTANEAASARMVQSLKDAGTNVLDAGMGLRDYKTDQVKNMLAQASRAGMQLDPTTGQPIDPTGTNLTAILDQARNRSDTATGLDMSGMVDFNALDQYQNKLAGNRRLKAEELRKVDAEAFTRSLDPFKKTEAELANSLTEQQLNIRRQQERRNELQARMKQEEDAEKVAKMRLEYDQLEEKIPFLLQELQANIANKNAATGLVNAQTTSAAVKDTKTKVETDLNKIELRKLKRLEAKAEEKQEHEDIVDGQIGLYNTFKEQGSEKQSWDALQHTINKNYQEGIAQPRLLELANQHLANSFDPTDGILKSELTALKGNRSSFAKTKLLNTISKRLKAKYTGLIPAIGNSKGLAATIKAQAESVIDNYIDPTTQLALGEEFKKESLYAKRDLTKLLKTEVDNEIASVQDTMAALRKKHADFPNDPTASISKQISALDKAKLKLTQLVDDKGNSLVNTRAAEKLIQPIRDQLLGQRNDLLSIDSFKISTTDSRGKSIERPMDLIKDLGISRLDLSLGKNPQARELASFTTFESKLTSALARDSRLYNTSKEARALKRNQILNSLSGYSTVKLKATIVQSAKDIVEQVKIKGPGLQAEAKQKFMVSFRTNKFPSADIAKQLIQNFPAQYDKDNIDSEAVGADVEITYNNMKELYKNQWAHVDEATGNILAIKNQDALDDLGYAVYRLYSGAEGKPRGSFDSSQEITSGSIPETSYRKNMVLGLPLGKWSTLEERTSISELSEDGDVFSSIIQRSGVFPKARYKASTAEEINKKAAKASKALNRPTDPYQLP